MKKSIASILVAHVVLTLLLVACSEDEPSKVDRPNEDHIHKACRFLVSRDGKAAVDYADYDLSQSVACIFRQREASFRSLKVMMRDIASQIPCASCIISR